MKRSVKSFVVAACLLPLLVGCQKGIAVGGKVSFPDGKPLATGIVCFQNDKTMARGVLDANGVFRLGTNTPNEGLAPGKYKVYVTEAFDRQTFPLPKTDDEPFRHPIETPLIDVKFMNPETSGLACDVVPGLKSFDITVDYPKDSVKDSVKKP